MSLLIIEKSRKFRLRYVNCKTVRILSRSSPNSTLLVGVDEKLSERVDRKVLKWYGHVERMSGERLTKRVYRSEVEGERGRGQPPFRWKDGVRRACSERNMGLEEARGICLDRRLWRMRVDGVLDG